MRAVRAGFLILPLLLLTCRHLLILLLLLHQQAAHLMLKQVCGMFKIIHSKCISIVLPAEGMHAAQTCQVLHVTAAELDC
jgi:hypothetical protein